MSDSCAFRFGNIRLPLLLATALLLTACANRSYMGIPLAESAGDPVLRTLAQRAAVCRFFGWTDTGAELPQRPKA